MRLWHYKLIQYLPKSQLVAQWRELNSIYKKQDNHILINYIYSYDKSDLLVYSNLVINEMTKRNYKIKNWENYNNYFKDIDEISLYYDFGKNETFIEYDTEQEKYNTYIGQNGKRESIKNDYSIEYMNNNDSFRGGDTYFIIKKLIV